MVFFECWKNEERALWNRASGWYSLGLAGDAGAPRSSPRYGLIA